MSGHDVNFFDQIPVFRDKPLGEPPHRVNGLDDTGYWDAIEIAAAEDGEPADPESQERKPFGRVLWAVKEPWDSSQIPRRPWVARGYLMRGAITVVSGAGGGGKSSLMIGWAAACAVGCAFRQFRTGEAVRVATYNVEDNQDEQKRRFSAMLRRMSLRPDAFGNRLAIVGPHEVGTLLIQNREGGTLVNTEAMDELETFVEEFRPDVLVLDPFVELHAAEENDNTAVRAVMARFRGMAARYNMAIVILHHARKGGGDPGDPDTLRGASSIVGAARVVLTVAVMTEDEAKTFNIPPEKRRMYFRLDGAKSNYAPIQEAEWFRREEEILDNGGDEPGDGVAVAWPWTPPTLFAETSVADINRALDMIRDGPAPGMLYTATRRGGASGWAGRCLFEVMGTSDEQAKLMIAAWLKSGLLSEVKYTHPQWRRDATGVRVDDAKRPTE